MITPLLFRYAAILYGPARATMYAGETLHAPFLLPLRPTGRIGGYHSGRAKPDTLAAVDAGIGCIKPILRTGILYKHRVKHTLQRGPFPGEIEPVPPHPFLPHRQSLAHVPKPPTIFPVQRPESRHRNRAREYSCWASAPKKPTSKPHLCGVTVWQRFCRYVRNHRRTHIRHRPIVPHIRLTTSAG